MEIYKKHALIYDQLYTDIFDYKKDFEYYGGIFKKHNCHKILEIGCGSGHLAEYFIKADFNYSGLDLSPQMIELAKERNPNGKFNQGDMRNLQFNEEFDGILIAGRSFTHLTTNSDVISCLKSVHRALKKNGIIVFDNFNAEIIFTQFEEHMEISKEYEDKTIQRISNTSKNLENGWTWNWDAEYIIKSKEKEERFHDFNILRAFTIDEINLFLKINGFKIISSGPHEYEPVGILTIASKT